MEGTPLPPPSLLHINACPLLFLENKPQTYKGLIATVCSLLSTYDLETFPNSV